MEKRQRFINALCIIGVLASAFVLVCDPLHRFFGLAMGWQYLANLAAFIVIAASLGASNFMETVAPERYTKSHLKRKGVRYENN
jgi:hypothetical protein